MLREGQSIQSVEVLCWLYYTMLNNLGPIGTDAQAPWKVHRLAECPLVSWRKAYKMLLKDCILSS